MIQLFGKHISLRWSLFGLSLAAMLPMVVFSAYTVVKVHQEQRQQALNDFQRRTTILGEKVEARLQIAIHLLEGLAASSAAQQRDWGTLYDTSQRVLAQHPQFRAITLVDASDQVLFLTSLPYGDQSVVTNYTELIQQALTTGKPNASGPFVTKIYPHKLIAITVPIPHGEQRHFALRMILLSTSISDLLTQDSLDPAWLAGVVDREGTVLARSRDADTFVGRRAGSIFLDAVQRKERHLFQSVSLEGIPITNATHAILDGDWVLGVGVPNEVLDAPLRAQLVQLVAVALACMALALGLSQWLAGRITREIRRTGKQGQPPA